MPKKKPPQRRKRSAPQGAESHQRKQERLEARRRAKEAALIAQQKKDRRDKAIRRAAFVVFLVAIIYLLFLRETSPTEIQGNQISSFSTSNGGQQTHASPYNYTEEETGVNPPVSGRHNPNPATCGTHSEPNSRTRTWCTRSSTVPSPFSTTQRSSISRISEILKGSSPITTTTCWSRLYDGLPDAVVIASWSRKMPLDNPELDVINEYIEQFRDTEPAPEASQQDCAHDEDDQFEPPEPSPAPSPEPSPSPEDGGGDDNGGGNEDGGNNNGTGGNESENENEGGNEDKGEDQSGGGDKDDDNGGNN